MVQITQLSGTPGRTFVLRLAEGEEVTSTILDFAADQQIGSGEITGIGALSDVVLGFFEMRTRDYHRNTVNEQVEVVSLVGNLAEQNGKPKLHAHIVVARRDAVALGGHLLSGHVRPTLELIITDSPSHLQRRTDPKTGLPLLDLGARP